MAASQAASQFVGSLTINGLANLFIIDDNNHLQQCINKGGVWNHTDLTSKSGGPNLGAAMSVTTMGNSSLTYCVFALDINGHLCSCTSTDGATWAWSNLYNSKGAPLQSSVGTAVVAGSLNVFGISTDYKLWTCINQGGSWTWINLSSLPGAPDEVHSFVGNTQLGQSSDAALVLQDGNNQYYVCYNHNVPNRGGWSWSGLEA